MKIRPGWERAGKIWFWRRGVYLATVWLGPGGWRWHVTTARRGVVMCSVVPTRRSRKARKQAEKALIGME